jgi:hypothetical protein
MLTTSRYSKDFPPCVIGWVDREGKNITCIFSSICVYATVFINFDNINHEYFRIEGISGDEVVKCDPIVVDITV